MHVVAIVWKGQILRGMVTSEQVSCPRAAQGVLASKGRAEAAMAMMARRMREVNDFMLD